MESALSRFHWFYLLSDYNEDKGTESLFCFDNMSDWITALVLLSPSLC